MWHALALSPGHVLAIGGGGIGSVLVHLFIWRLLWRLALLIWHIPVAGPAIDGLLVLAAVALILRRSAGLGMPRWPGQRRDGGQDRGQGTGQGSRDW
jgi:hypothetical protein